MRWTEGAWPAHIVALDIALTVVVVAAVVAGTRGRWTLPPLLVCYAHLAVVAHLIPVPKTRVGWGETVVTVGFALLAGSLFTSYRFRAYSSPNEPTSPRSLPLASTADHRAHDGS